MLEEEYCATEFVEAAQNDGNFLHQLFNSNACCTNAWLIQKVEAVKYQ